MSSEKSGFDPSWEKEVYSQGNAISRYPFGELVPLVFRLFGSDLRGGKKLKALELGSGSGNNLAFLAKEGFETVGIDGSETACEISRAFLKKQNLEAEILCADFTRLPFENNSFDLILDREAVYANRKNTILRVAAEVLRCLKPGGRYLTFTYSDSHGSIGKFGSKALEPNTYDGFESGPFYKTGVAHFFSKDEIVQEYLKGFEIEFMLHHQNDRVLPQSENIYSEYITCGRKPL